MKNIYKITTIVFCYCLFIACGGNGEEEVSLMDKPIGEIMNMTSADLEKMMEGMSVDEKKKLVQDFKSILKPTELKINQIEKVVKKDDPNYTGKKEKKSKLVSLTNASVKDVETFVEVTGIVQSKDDTKVMAETTGRITSLGLKEDRYLKKGDFVMSVDDETIRRGIAEQETQLALARTVLEKRDRLWAQGIGTEIELIQARTNVEALTKSIATTQSSLDKFNQSATVSGIIEDVYVNEGEMVMAGSPLAAIMDLSVVTVQAELVESYLSKIKRGDPAVIEFPALDLERRAKISDIGSRIDAGSRSFNIEMDIVNKGYKLKPNVLANVKLRENFIEDAVVIPTNLVQEDFGGEFVFIAEQVDGKFAAKKVSIETSEVLETETVIKSGLTGDEVLIDKGFRDVVEGQPIEVSLK